MFGISTKILDMSNKRIAMTDIKHLLRLKKQGRSNRAIAGLLHVHRNTVNTYIQVFTDSGQSLDALLALPEAALLRLVEPPPEAASARQAVLLALFPKIEAELRKTGATILNVWEKVYRPQGGLYSYVQFTRLVGQQLKKKEVGLRCEHRLGDKLFVDFSGKKLPVTNPKTGQVELKEVFVAILGASQYTYVEAVDDQTLDNFLSAVQNALHFFGGVPRAIVPDNLKSAVTKADKYEPEVNRNFEAMSQHYGTVILPTRAARPRDKALVEGAVKLVYQRIFYPLNDLVFYSLADLNAAIWQHLDAYNRRPMQVHQQSRAELFEEEKKVLTPCPSTRYERRDFRRGEVNKDAHVWFGPDKHYYSAPYRFVGKSVFVLATRRVVEVYLAATHERIALHSRSGRVGAFTTCAEHLPPNVRFVRDWSFEQFEKLAAEIGPQTGAFFRQIFQHKAHPEQACKACMGVLSLKKAFPADRIEAACGRALLFENFRYEAVKNILQKGLDALQIEDSARSDQPGEAAGQLCEPHPNIRGADYFA